MVEPDAREIAWAHWRERLAHLGGNNTLLHIDLSSDGVLDLTTCHPGGLAQLIAGRRTKLANLVRDEQAYERARIAALAIDQKSAELAEDRGIDAIALATGIVHWSSHGESFTAPALLQPVLLRSVGDDFELQMGGAASPNRVLATELLEQLGITLSEQTLIDLAHEGGSFRPDAALHYLTEITKSVPGVLVSNRRILSTFADVARSLADDAQPIDHPVLDALAGVPGARTELRSDFTPVQPIPPDVRSPESDRLLLDASDEQERVIAQIAAGSSLIVNTVPGSGVTQTVVNAIGCLVEQNKRVAVIGASRASLRKVAAKLSSAGLAGVALAPSSMRRDLITAISHNERAVRPEHDPHGERLVTLRSALHSYSESLLKPRADFGVSVEQTLAALAALAAKPSPPMTTARIPVDSLKQLADHRGDAASVLESIAKLGEFKHGPSDTAWYGAHFVDAAQAEGMYIAARRLATDDLPQLIERANELFHRSGLVNPTSVNQIGEYIRLLLGVRDTLEKFTPRVYDRSLQDVIIATSPRQEALDMSRGDRRRLRQLAREYVRPGLHVGDLHLAMRQIQKQRMLWQRSAIAHTPPNVPSGLGDLNVQYNAVSSDLQALGAVLSPTAVNGDLLNLTFDDLEATLKSLTDNADALTNLTERTTLQATLKSWGLSALMNDLASRHVSQDDVADELELAWWQSLLELQLTQDGALLGADTAALATLERDFAEADAAHMSVNPRAFAWERAERWKAALETYPGQAGDLRTILRSGAISADVLFERADDLGRVLSPVWLLSPYLFAQQVPARTFFDTVILLDAASLSVAEAVLPISKANQVVSFGDPVLGTPTAFEIGIEAAAPRSDETPRPAARPRTKTTDLVTATFIENFERKLETISVAEIEQSEATEPERPDTRSIHVRLADVLPMLSLHRSYRPGGRGVAQVVNDRFYGGSIIALPAAAEFLGTSSVDVSVVTDGTGLPNPETGAVEGVPAEVRRTVEVVLSSVVWHPNESLMVVTASDLTARLVRAAVREELANRPHLSGFFRSDVAEPFVVLTIEQAATRSRDRVIFSIGYGRTPHGRVISQFGPISGPDGEQNLAIALTRARNHLTIVSCFKPNDLRADRLTGGSAVLAEVLTEADRRGEVAGTTGRSQPLLDDLGRRLARLGAKVGIDFGDELSLVASNGKSAIAIESDAGYARGALRETVRQRPALLRHLGWRVERVYSFELFRDPQAVAHHIAEELGLHQPENPSEQSNAPRTSRAQPQDRARHPRVIREGAGEPMAPDVAPEDTDRAWGDKPVNEDEWLTSQKPPHWS